MPAIAPETLPFSKGDYCAQIFPMQAKDLLVDPSQLGAVSADSWQPLGFVDLRSCPEDIPFAQLPAFPLIGLGGGPGHPLAGLLDALVEAPVSAEALIRQITRAPHAAAVTAQLLRSLEGLDVERALQLESLTYGLLQGSAEYATWLAGRVPAAQPAPAGKVTIERHGPVLHVLIDRPGARNALNRQLRDELVEAFTLAALDHEVRSIKLRAVGPTFSVGGDLEEFGTTRDPATAHLIRSRTLPAVALIPRASILDVHIQGACVGAGVEIAAFAGRVTATADAWFQLPELSMGLIPGAGGCVSVPRRIGRQRAALLLLSGRRINAVTAREWGLIDAIVESPPS
jgi:enoyl-CoA hydratase/carnithine racemase